MRTKPLFRTALVLVFLVGVALLSSCRDQESKAKVVDPNHYTKNGVEFDYPGDWKVTGDKELEGGVRYLFVESPDNALVMVHIIPKIAASDLHEFSRDLSNATKEEVEGAAFVGSKFGEAGEDGKYATVEEELTIDMADVSIPHARKYYRREIGDVVCFLTTQVPVDEQAASNKGLAQVVQSFQLNGK
jgi:hypothetical protein